MARVWERREEEFFSSWGRRWLNERRWSRVGEDERKKRKIPGPTILGWSVRLYAAGQTARVRPVRPGPSGRSNRRHQAGQTAHIAPVRPPGPQPTVHSPCTVRLPPLNKIQQKFDFLSNFEMCELKYCQPFITFENYEDLQQNSLECYEVTFYGL